MPGFARRKVFGGVCLAVLLVAGCSASAGRSSEATPQPRLPAMAALFRDADEALRAGRISGAFEAYNKAVAFDPEEPLVWQRLGRLYLAVRNLDQAAVSYRTALEKGRNTADVHFELGYIEEMRQDWAKALVHYQEADHLGGRSPALFYNMGNVCARQGDNSRAIGYYRKAVDMDPGHMDALVNLSSVSFYEGKYADAKLWLDKAVRLGYKAPQEYLDVLAEKIAASK